MGNWNQILSEINAPRQSPYDEVRRFYLSKLSKLTGRNVLCYYSGWLQKTGDQFHNVTQITDEDKAGFMSCFHQMDRGRGLDMLVHSPGGYVSATESLILRKMGLIIKDLEGDDDIQDAILSVHHAFMITLSIHPQRR